MLTRNGTILLVLSPLAGDELTLGFRFPGGDEFARLLDALGRRS